MRVSSEESVIIAGELAVGAGLSFLIYGSLTSRGSWMLPLIMSLIQITVLVVINITITSQKNLWPLIIGSIAALLGGIIASLILPYLVIECQFVLEGFSVFLAVFIIQIILLITIANIRRH